jgi:N-methylhydantoinase B
LNLDGFDKPITIKARMEIKKKSIVVDLSESSKAVSRGINCPLNYSIAYASYGIKAAICPEVPNNAASLSRIQVISQSGLVVSAEKPSPVTARHVIGQALPDLVLGCLSKALPGKILSESSGALWTISLTGSGKKNFSSLNVALGGMGARPTSDGLSTTAFPSGVGAVSVEIAEAAAPVIYHKKEFQPDSGGNGEFRGGLGQEIVIGTLTNEPYILSAAAFERTRQGPAGRSGGKRGGKGKVMVSDGSIIEDKGNYEISKGQMISLTTPGGGGFGKPSLRSKAQRSIDLKNGLTTKY